MCNKLNALELYVAVKLFKRLEMFLYDTKSQKTPYANGGLHEGPSPLQSGIKGPCAI